MKVYQRIQDDMKRALTIVLVLALPLMAEEKKAEEKKAANTTATTATTSTAAEAQAAQPDSPLVAAAKRANRLGKKPAYVITNETLRTSGGNAHVTTTTNQPTIQMPKPLEPPRPTPEMVAADAKAKERKKLAEQAEKERLARQEQARKAEQEAAAREEGYDGMQDDASEFVGSEPPPPQF